MTDLWIVPEDHATLPRLLAAYDGPWWLAGGWAIDEFLGHQTRDHQDVEVSVLFRDQDQLHEALASWDLHVALDGSLSPWVPGDRLEMPRHQLWGRRSPTAPWSLEILFEEADGADWRFRRDHRVRRPLSDFGRVARSGLPIVAPEIQLLFKSQRPRDRDQADFRSALPALDAAARGWLTRSLCLIDEDHEWLASL